MKSAFHQFCRAIIEANKEKFLEGKSPSLKHLSKFGRCHTHFRDLRRFLVVFLGRNTVKTGHNLENIYKYEKILTNNFFKNLKMCFKQRNKFA